MEEKERKRKSGEEISEEIGGRKMNNKLSKKSNRSIEEEEAEEENKGGVQGKDQRLNKMKIKGCHILAKHVGLNPRPPDCQASVLTSISPRQVHIP